MMTPEQQKIAIAEWMGWKKCCGNCKCWIPPKGIDLNIYKFIPYEFCGCTDYPNDLNACHEAEKKLTDNQKDSYAIKLFYIVFPRKGYELDCTTHFHTIHASSSQRSEALCRILFPERFI
jgi:hypothetical protein